MKLSFPKSRSLVTTVQLLPPIFGLLLFLLGCIPHFYFIMDGEIYTDMSFFGILSNTLSNCFSFLNGTANGSVAELYFSYIMLAFSILTILLLLMDSFYLGFTAVLAVAVQTFAPTAQRLNQMKRYYRLFVPNRATAGVYQLFPLLAAFFPYLIRFFYRSRLGLSATLYFYALPDPVWVLLFALLSILLSLWAKQTEKELHLDLFTLYKS